MATREIKTTIALDGEQKFKQALSAATREMRVMESELKAVSAAYDTNGNSAEYFAAKQSNLRDQISQQRQIIQALERAVEDAAQAYGEGSSQVDGYAIRLNNARTRMSRLEQQLEETDREIEELGRDSIRAGRQLEDGIGEGAESAERSVRDLVNTMKEDISSIRTSTAFTAVSDLWDMASGAFDAVSGFVEGTADYRRQLSFLEFNAEENGFGMDGVIDKMIEAQAVTADASAAVEGLSNLLNIEGLSERQFTSAFQNMLGASVRWPETMKFENLAESLQETLATGEAVGAYAELLDRLGVNIEEVNKALEESPSAEGDIDVALAYMDSKELRETYEKYKDNNEDLINELMTVARLEYQAARLGETLAEHITTPIKSKTADLFKWINDEIEKFEKDPDEYIENIPSRLEESRKETMDEAVNAAVETVLSPKEKNQQIVKNNLSLRESIIKAFSKIAVDGADAFTNPQAEINATKEVQDKLAQEAADFKKAMMDWEDYNSKPMESVMEEAAENAGKKAGKQYGSSFADAYKDFSNNEFPQLPNPLDNVSPGQTLIDSLGVGEEWKQKLDEIAMSAQTAVPTVQAAGETVGTALSTGFEESAGEVEDAAEDAGETAGNAFEGAASQFTTVSRMIGVQYGRAFGDGIVSQYGYVASASKRLASAASSAFGGARSNVASGAAAAASGNVTAVLNIDGRTFARVTAPYMATALSHD